MKTMKNYCFVLLLAITTFLFSCDDNDGYSIGDIAADWVTVKSEGNGVYSFVGDSWGSMWPATSHIWNYNPADGDRAVLYFNPLYDNYGGYDLAISPEVIYPVLTKGVEQLTVDNEEEYADHPAYVTDVWISGGYMNMTFYQKLPQSKKHRVSLVENSIVEREDDGYLYLEFRYNTYADTLSNAKVGGAVSYNLSSLQLDDKKGIKLRINSAVNGERFLTFDKSVGGTPVEGKKMDLSQSVKIE